jgi:hypothetical protein
MTNDFQLCAFGRGTAVLSAQVFGRFEQAARSLMP